MNRADLPLDQQFYEGLEDLLENGRNLQKGFQPFYRIKEDSEEDATRDEREKFKLRVNAFGEAISKAEIKGDAGIFNKNNLEKYRQLKEISDSLQN